MSKGGRFAGSQRPDGDRRDDSAAFSNPNQIAPNSWQGDVGERWNSLGIFLRFHWFPVGLEEFKCIFKTLIIIVIGARQDSDYLECVHTRCLICAYHNQTSVPTPQCFSPGLELYDSTRMEQPTNQQGEPTEQTMECDGEKPLTT